MKLRDYQYEIIYKTGKTNKNADALSRNPVNPEKNCVHQIRILPLTTENEKNKRFPPVNDESSSESDDLGIASRVRKRNLWRPRPSYMEHGKIKERRCAHESSDSESETDSSSSRKSRRNFKGTLKYEDDVDYQPPAALKFQPISLQTLFREGNAPSVDIIVDPTLLMESPSATETERSIDKSESNVDNQSSC